MSDTTDTQSDIRILIVDDHPVVREGISQIIDAEPGLHVCAKAEDAQEAIDKIKVSLPDVAIVDISLKGVNGIELVRDLKSRYPHLRILVFSMHDEAVYAERALRAGALGYIMKQEETGLLMKAIRTVHRNELFVSDAVKNKILKSFAHAGSTHRTPIESLSDRELEVFQMIGHGKGTREIAEKLHLSVKTIESHRTNIKRKLKLRTAMELSRYAFEWVQKHGQA